ncbi:TetR/AcrR family transcriptional regulator [Streptomonospora salina]|uniref:AcrR family transcriptional regulator n=1 Tax=Streptomonospora salina TaxID=104205 RepID=A0A841EH54_9ACTN|nr:TetR/AcrR family transcriptional regulator [Streptomonospora salina]MBB6000158.1 AcrR family transcriptional regulator [Streptomonospora salina]
MNVAKSYIGVLFCVSYDRLVPQSQPSAVPSTTARRTRRVIVDAAIETLAADPAATLAEIAEAGDLSRSTLHRHFADRDELLTAIDAECRRRFTAATSAARLGDGGALNALDRLALEYLDLGPVLGLIFADNAPIDPDTWEDSDGREQGLSTTIERGQNSATEGDIDPELPPDWVLTTFWVLLFGAWLSLKNGMNRRDVATYLSRTFRKAVGTAH